MTLSCCHIVHNGIFHFSVFLSSPLNAAIPQLVKPPKDVVIYVSLAFYMNESVSFLIVLKDRPSPISPCLKHCQEAYWSHDIHNQEAEEEEEIGPGNKASRPHPLKYTLQSGPTS